MFSDDDGMSWTDKTQNVSEQLEKSGAGMYPGSTPGPCQGIQVRDLSTVDTRLSQITPTMPLKIAFSLRHNFCPHYVVDQETLHA
jgi:hypothetical protein